MADHEQLEQLKKGAEVWNMWRQLNVPGIPDFSAADLRGAKLISADLHGAKLIGAKLNSADLRGADLNSANLNSTYFNEANLTGASLRGANLCYANLNEANLNGASLSGADLRIASLKKADVVSANLREANLREANLSGANLRWADLRGADLRKANLNGASLCGAVLNEADLSEADLSGADLSRAHFNGVNLGGANLSEANLSGTNLSEANLSDADLSGANLTDACLKTSRLQRAKLDNATLTGANLWETQRAGWSIRGLVCELAYWDLESTKASEYAPNEFEKLHSDQTVIELVYKGGISAFELNTLPALLRYLTNLHSGSHIRLKSVDESTGGSKVTFVLEETDEVKVQDIKSDAERLQRFQMEYRDVELRANKLKIENALLLDEVFPRMLGEIGSRVQIQGPATGIVIANNSTVNAQQAINDLSSIRQIIGEVASRLGELPAGPERAELAAALRDLQGELRKGSPSDTAVSTGLKFVIDTLSGMAGAMLANNDWGLLFAQLKVFASSFRL